VCECVFLQRLCVCVYVCVCVRLNAPLIFPACVCVYLCARIEAFEVHAYSRSVYPLCSTRIPPLNRCCQVYNRAFSPLPRMH
jgi:hypothetical protein